MKWIKDDAGDLVNLYNIQVISLAPLEQLVPLGEVDQDIPEEATHEILAINTEQESYRLYIGSEASCREFIQHLYDVLQVEGHAAR